MLESRYFPRRIARSEIYTVVVVFISLRRSRGIGSIQMENYCLTEHNKFVLTSRVTVLIQKSRDSVHCTSSNLSSMATCDIPCHRYVACSRRFAVDISAPLLRPHMSISEVVLTAALFRLCVQIIIEQGRMPLPCSTE